MPSTLRPAPFASVGNPDGCETDEPAERFHLDDLSLDPPAPKPLPAPRGSGGGGASSLRREINAHALRFAHTHRLPHDIAAGGAVLFAPYQTSDGSPAHGNFAPESYRAILADPSWTTRLAKAHTAHRRAWPRTDWHWRELDTAVSSDALLMSVFCYPGVLERPGVQALLGTPSGSRPEFGYHPRIPLINGRLDRTEVDLRVGSLLIEAKLTETSFGTARPALTGRYRDLSAAFHPHLLDPAAPHYQLLRGTLAALAEPTTTFCLLADARRPDLREAWSQVMASVRTADLRCRLQMLTWQELAAVLPSALQLYLLEKYNILRA